MTRSNATGPAKQNASELTLHPGCGLSMKTIYNKDPGDDDSWLLCSGHQA